MRAASLRAHAIAAALIATGMLCASRPSARTKRSYPGIVATADTADSGLDAGVDAGVDAGADGGIDGGIDGGADAGSNISAILLDGDPSAEYVNIPHSTTFDFTTAFSVSVWFRHTGAWAANDDVVARWGGSKNSWEVVSSSAGALRFFVASSNTDASNAVSCSGHSGDTAYHAVFTYNAGTVKYYRNGTDVTSGSCSTIGTIPSSLNTSARDLYIGGRGTNYWPGEIDEVAIFNTVLSSSDVALLRNGSSPANNITGISGLVSWWRLGDGSDSTSAGGFVDRLGVSNGTGVGFDGPEIVATPF